MSKYKTKKQKKKKQFGGALTDAFDNNDTLTTLLNQFGVLESKNPFAGGNTGKLLEVIFGQILNPMTPRVGDNITLSDGFQGFQQGGQVNPSNQNLSLSPFNSFVSEISKSDPFDLAQLAIETRRHESGSNFGTEKEFVTKQFSGGPGRGAFQIEPAELKTRAKKARKIYEELGMGEPDILSDLISGEIKDASELPPQLQEDLFYAGLTQLDGEGNIKPTRSLNSIKPDSLENRSKLWARIHNRTEDADRREKKRRKFLLDNSPKFKKGGLISKSLKKEIKKFVNEKEEQTNELRSRTIENQAKAKKELLKESLELQNLSQNISGFSIFPSLERGKSDKPTRKSDDSLFQQGGFLNLFGQDDMEDFQGNLLIPGRPSTFTPLLPSNDQLIKILSNNGTFQDGGVPITPQGQFQVPNGPVIVPSGVITTQGVDKPFVTVTPDGGLNLLLQNTGIFNLGAEAALEVPVDVKPKEKKKRTGGRRIGKKGNKPRFRSGQKGTLSNAAETYKDNGVY